MTTVPPIVRSATDCVLAPDSEVEATRPPPSRQEVRQQRKEAARSGRGTVAALFVCAGVPTAVVLSLWSNLTLPFWYNEQWRAYYISNQNNWWEALKSDGAPAK